MDSTKNFFDAWMNTQSKLVDNLMDTSKKIQASIGKNDVVEKSMDLYNQWFDKQKNLADSMISTIQGASAKPQTPDFLKDWMESQMQLGKKWLEVLNISQNNNSSNTKQNYFENMQGMYENWNGIYQQIISKINQPYQNLNVNSFSPNNFMTLMENTQTYMKMFEIWQPIYKMTQSNAMGIESLTKMMDMDKYKEIIDGMFQLMTPEKSQSFLMQIKQYGEMWTGLFNLQNVFNGSISQLQNLIPTGGFVDKNLGTLATLSQQFSEQLQGFINPYFTMIPAGQEKQILASVMQVQDKLSKYFIKTVEMQNLVYTTSQQAIEKVVREIMQKVSQGNYSITFDEFYTVWVETMETSIIQLFGSDTYAESQGNLLKIGLEIKASLNKQMEMLLAPLPLVPRSEMDELNATVHELKSKVRILESKLTTLTEQQKTDNHHANGKVEQPISVQLETEKDKNIEATIAMVKKTSNRKTTKAKQEEI